jgi:hypothetical protein
MAVKQELAQLLAELKNTRSPVGRVKLLARGWRVLRDLDPVQRHELARQLGIDGAEEWLDRSAGARRLDRAWLDKLLRKARTLEVEELRSRARSLQDPGARGELLRRGIDAMAGEFVGAEADTTLDVAEAADAEGTQEAPLGLPVSAPAVVDELERPTRAASSAPSAVEPAAETGPTVAPVNEPPTPKPAPAVPAVAAVATITATQPTVAEAPSEPQSPPRETVGFERAAEIVDQVRNSARLMLRFRLLRRHLDDLRGASPDQLRSLIESFPGGWARRRALALLLRQRIPDSLHRAVFLVESLETVASRRWCIATLLAYWDLSPVERETLIERHDSPRFRARRRAGRAASDRATPPA